MDQVTRVTAVLAVTRAVLDTLGPRHAARVLVGEFGWDVAFQSLALLRGRAAAEALGLVWQQLLITAPEVTRASIVRPR